MTHPIFFVSTIGSKTEGYLVMRAEESCRYRFRESLIEPIGDFNEDSLRRDTSNVGPPRTVPVIPWELLK